MKRNSASYHNCLEWFSTSPDTIFVSRALPIGADSSRSEPPAAVHLAPLNCPTQFLSALCPRLAAPRTRSPLRWCWRHFALFIYLVLGCRQAETWTKQFLWKAAEEHPLLGCTILTSESGGGLAVFRTHRRLLPLLFLKDMIFVRSYNTSLWPKCYCTLE